MVTQVLAYTEREELKALLEVVCKSITGFSPIFRGSLDELQAMLEIFPLVDVLIVDTFSSEAEFDVFIEGLMKKGDSLKNVIVIGEGKSVENFKFFPRGEVAAMLAYLKDRIGHSKAEADGYVSIPVSVLSHFSKLPFELYVRISEDKYIKRIHAFEDIDGDTIQGLMERGILSLHFQRRHNKVFSTLLINNMIDRVDAEYGDEDEELRAKAEVFGTVKGIVNGLGLAPRVVKVCESLVAEMAAGILHGGGELARHLERLKSNAGLAFHYRFIELTCYIGSHMLLFVGMRGRDEEVRRFIFAAFFCDMALKDQDHIHHLQLENDKVLKVQGVKEVRDHAMKAASLVERHGGAPVGVAEIIRQHHGTLDGVGFLINKSPEMEELTKYLIVSQELAYGMLTLDEMSPLQVVEIVMRKNKGTILEEITELFEVSLRKE